MSANNLSVTFLDEERILEPGTDLTFGRDADLSIDEDNNYLHRQLGMFSFQDGAWHLHNVGSALSIELLDHASTNQLTVTPGTAVRLPFENGLVRIQAGRARYELEIRGVAISKATIAPPEGPGSTMTPEQLVLTDEQRLLLVALAELRLLDRGAPITAIPTNQAIAERLGWTTTKYNRKLDRMCDAFADAGVSGLVGSATSRAKNRRVRLVDYVLNTRTITEADLTLLTGEGQ